MDVDRIESYQMREREREICQPFKHNLTRSACCSLSAGEYNQQWEQHNCPHLVQRQRQTPLQWCTQRFGKAEQLLFFLPLSFWCFIVLYEDVAVTFNMSAFWKTFSYQRRICFSLPLRIPFWSQLPTEVNFSFLFFLFCFCFHLEIEMLVISFT